MKFPLITALACAAALLCGRAAAQGTENLLTSVGTTVQTAGTTHAYLLWQPGEAAATLGKRFAIYRKSGPADSTDNFSRLGIQTLQTSANTIRALLELGAKVDRAAAAAPARIDGLYRQITLATGDVPATPADPTLDAGAKLAFLIQSAVSDPRTLSRLFFLGRAHPGVMMALGHAFAIPVSAGIHTFEIREIGSSDNDIQVVGRVTLDTTAPVIPAPPAAPVQVFHPLSPDSANTLSPKDHLNVRLRWGVSPALRAQMPHTFGFDVFRVKQATAESLGWDAAPPSPAELVTALIGTDPANPDPEISQANELPVLIGDLLTPAQAVDQADTERFDFSDDGIWHVGANGSKVRRPYTDGESYYYYIAARGITGMPGLLSNGSLVTMCDRLPPRPPAIASVLSTFVRPTTPADWQAQGGSQFLQVKIRQLPSAETTGYYIYRWSSPQEYLNNLGNPVIGRVAFVPHDENDVFLTFNDNGAGAPTLATHHDKSVWYTVRALGRSACDDQALSGHSAPTPGVLRDFKAPDGPTGDFLVCRHMPNAAFVNRVVTAPPTAGYTGIGVNAVRTSDMIVAADIELALAQGNNTYLIVHSSRYTYQNGNSIHIDLPYPIPATEQTQLRIRVRGITTLGLISDYALTVNSDSQQPPYAIFNFNLGALEVCPPVSSVPESPALHEAFTPSGDVNPIGGSLSFPANQGVGEWRIYRRVGKSGPLSLIAKAEGDSLPSPVEWEDDALPAANGSSVCYFGQIFDQNANPSPLIPLGCMMVSNPDLPTPMLSPATITGQIADRMQVKLEWFCDPVGVDRFEILAAREGGGVPEIIGITALTSDTVPNQSITDFPELTFHIYQTSRIGGSLGAGPAFSITIEAPTDAAFAFAVRACGPGASNVRARGSVSNVVSARWQLQPDGPQSVIPWPARPLPSSFDHRQAINRFTATEGPLWPLDLPTNLNTPTGILVGLTGDLLDSSNGNEVSPVFFTVPPEQRLFKIRENTGSASTLTDLMPCMLYRYQVPSEAFPSARANLVQCTPLIDRMSWKENLNIYTLRDPFFMVLRFSSALKIPVAGDWSETATPTLADPATYTPLPPYLKNATGMILLKDPLPVTVGAKYRHLIVRFDTRGEIKHVIPFDAVQH